MRRSRLVLAGVALAAAVVLAGAALAVRARSDDEDARLRTAVAAYEAAATAGRGFDSGLTRTILRSRAQALLTQIAVAEDREAAAQADVLLGVLAAGGGRSAAGETPDELSRDLFETAVRLDNGNVAAKFDLELAVRRLRAVGARTGAGQGSGPRGGGRRGAGAGLPGRGY
jgi:hypothetical protein